KAGTLAPLEPPPPLELLLPPPQAATAMVEESTASAAANCVVLVGLRFIDLPAQGPGGTARPLRNGMAECLVLHRPLVEEDSGRELPVELPLPRDVLVLARTALHLPGAGRIIRGAGRADRGELDVPALALPGLSAGRDRQRAGHLALAERLAAVGSADLGTHL